jgi:hypothetical protein
MKTKALGLACLTTAAMSPLAALDVDLQVGPDEARLSAELLNQQWSNNAIINPAATGHLAGDFRWYDIGIHIDGYMALDGGPTSAEIHDFETTDVTLRIDYLFEVEQYVQILPFIEITSYPFFTGSPKYNWLGIDAWYLTPLEGLEVGASVQYNLDDSAPGGKEADPEHHVLVTSGVRYLYQEAPLDVLVWSLLDIGSASYHKATTGADTQGLNTFKMGGRMTLPLPWEETWLYGQAEQIFYVDSEDRSTLKDAGRDRSELVFAVGVEWRAE